MLCPALPIHSTKIPVSQWGRTILYNTILATFQAVLYLLCKVLIKPTTVDAGERRLTDQRHQNLKPCTFHPQRQDINILCRQEEPCNTIAHTLKGLHYQPAVIRPPSAAEGEMCPTLQQSTLQEQHNLLLCGKSTKGWRKKETSFNTWNLHTP